MYVSPSIIRMLFNKTSIDFFNGSARSRYRYFAVCHGYLIIIRSVCVYFLCGLLLRLNFSRIFSLHLKWEFFLASPLCMRMRLYNNKNFPISRRLCRLAFLGRNIDVIAIATLFILCARTHKVGKLLNDYRLRKRNGRNLIKHTSKFISSTTPAKKPTERTRWLPRIRAAATNPSPAGIISKLFGYFCVCENLFTPISFRKVFSCEAHPSRCVCCGVLHRSHALFVQLLVRILTTPSRSAISVIRKNGGKMVFSATFGNWWNFPLNCPSTFVFLLLHKNGIYHAHTQTHRHK